MNTSFITFIALRYVRAQRKSKRTASSFLSVTGIAVGVMTLIVVIGVMNGFQLSFIEPIINIGSYHLQISGKAELDAQTLSHIRAIPGVTALVRITETQAILDGKAPCMIRGLPLDFNELDPSFAGSFSTAGYEAPSSELLSEKDSIVVGSQLALKLGLGRGDEVSVTTLNGLPYSKKRITGIFQTWYYDIDSQWAFVSLDTAKSFYTGGYAGNPTYGIKIKDRFNDGAVVAELTRLVGGLGYTVGSWREYDPGFFNALLMEKVMMMVLVGLIFIVVGFNIFHSQKRAVLEKKEEIGILKAIGAQPGSIRNIFLFEGFLIGFMGCAIGVLLGMLVGYNINELFRFIEYVVNKLVLANLKLLLDPLVPNVRFERISIFSSDVFYIDKIHTRILLSEIVFICFIAISSSTLAALFASSRVSDIKPREVLRYE